MEAKSVWLSKTLWVNVIAIIALVVQSYTGYALELDTQVVILGAINALLRLITKSPVVWTGGGSQSGFAQLPILFFISVLFICCLTGCATTETPQSLAAKSLLSTRQGVIAAATTVDGLCAQGVVKQKDCDRASGIYSQAQAAYLTASDAFLLYLQISNDISLQKFQAAQSQLQALFLDIDGLAKTFQGGAVK
ncbi:MAG: hypothetical protein VB050_03325 [Geobacteraceae bacterium]|nr:hypothetical protein [Geobacteraceae bacterium]